MPPSATGLASSLYCFNNSSSAALLDEPTCENPMVLPLRSSILRIGEAGNTYQNRSGEPIISLPITRIGAPLAKAPTAAETPTPVPISMLRETTAWIDSGPPWV